MKKDIYKNLKKFSLSGFIKKMHPKKSLRGVIFGNFGAMNLGDEAILAGELKELKKVSNLKVHVVSRNPGEIERVHHAKSISLFNVVKIINEVRESDFIIVGGGGIMCKSDRNLIGLTYQIYTLILSLLLPKLFKKNIYAVGIGVYRNTNPFILYVAILLLRSVKLLTVRDFHSHELLREKNVKSTLFKDNSFLMDLLSKKTVQKYKFFENKYNTGKKNIGFALMKPDGKLDEERAIKRIIAYVKKHYKESNFWFYSCDFQGNYYNDRKFSEKVYDRIKKEVGSGPVCFFIPENWSPQKFFSSFKLMDYFVTMRLHASIFAYRNNIKFESIPYDIKCVSFLESIGKSQNMVSDAAATENKSVAKSGIDALPNIKRLFVPLLTLVRRGIYILLSMIDVITLAPKNKISVLSYHSVNEDNWRFSIDAAEIKKQISYLKKHYNFITLKTLEDYLNGKKQILRPSIILTFDDGYEDILKMKTFFEKNKIKPALFVLGNPEGANRKELDTNRPFLTKDGIVSLAKSGWEIGSHTNTHSNLVSLSQSDMNSEIIQSKKMLEKILETDIRYFAYPRGKYNEHVLKTVKKAGYSLGLTMDEGIISKDTNPLLIPRIGVDRTHNFMEFKTLPSPSNIDLRRVVKSSLLGRFI